jgi:hypothetical protein
MKAAGPGWRRIQHVAVLDKDAGSCALACLALGRAKTLQAVCPRALRERGRIVLSSPYGESPPRRSKP